MEIGYNGSMARKKCSDCGTGLTIKRIAAFSVPLVGTRGQRAPIFDKSAPVFICPHCDRGVDAASNETHKHFDT